MEILNSLIRENNISFLRISIVDILGEKRSIEFPASALKDIYNNLVKCDGSSLCGIGTADNSDRVFVSMKILIISFLIIHWKYLAFCKKKMKKQQFLIHVKY